MSGTCCKKDWVCTLDTDCGTDPNYGPCSTSGPCPGGGGGGGGGDGSVKGCETVCGTSSLMSTSTAPTIKGISISNSNLIINYGGGAPTPTDRGVNPWPPDYGSKVMWLYACPNAQGLACLPKKYSDNLD